MQSRLLLSGRERPRGARAALLTEHEAQLLRRFELRLVGPEGRARLGQLQRAQQVDAEVALLTANLRRRALGRSPGLHCLHQSHLDCDRIERTAAIKAPIPEPLKGRRAPTPQIAEESSAPARIRVLVTGASGFVGSLLVGRLRAEGHAVRALGREPTRVLAALAHARSQSRHRASSGRADAGGDAGVEVVRGDVLSTDGLAQALDGVEVAYYLIHSMERPASGDTPFAERDRVAAENFAEAAADAGVRRIVYLGGLVPRPRAPAAPAGSAAPVRISRHLASREQVERILLEASADSLALRSSIVIGARSRSFRLLVRLLERMPVLALPSWHSLRTQPIDERDVIAMLAACATTERLSGRSLDIGGMDVLTYGQMLQSIAELMLVNRPALKLGVKLTGVTARVAAAIAGEDPELVVALMEGLQDDLLPAADRAAELLGVRLHSFDSAVEHALAEWEAFEPLAAR